MLNQTLKITMLYDFYGSLLTERQQKAIEMHYLEDMSLAEVAEEFSVSRQAVHDILKRAVQAMQELDDKLCLVKKHEEKINKISQIDDILGKAVSGSKSGQKDISEARIMLKDLLT